jgi:hypothetical protein
MWDGVFSTLLEFKGLSKPYGRGAQPPEQVDFCRKTVNPNGVAIVETGNLARPAGMFVRYIDFTHESGFTENSLRQILRAIGFSDIVITGNLPGVYSWRSYLRIAVQMLWHQCLRVLCSPRLGRGTESAITTVNRPRNSTTPSVGSLE